MYVYTTHLSPTLIFEPELSPETFFIKLKPLQVLSASGMSFGWTADLLSSHPKKIHCIMCIYS